MNLDTLCAEPDEGRLLLTWRGLDRVQEDDLRDVKTVLVASEKLTTGAPDCVRRTSGSRPRWPSRMALLTPVMMG